MTLATDNTIYFTGKEMLGLITDSSVTIKLIPAVNVDVYSEFGTISNKFSQNTTIIKATAGNPIEILINNLIPDTEYSYRIIYKATGSSDFIIGNEYTFHTQRPKGVDFTFTIQADPHRDEFTNEELYRLTLNNVLKDNPDFHIDLGDTFMCEKFAINEQTVINRYLQDRAFFDIVACSTPLFLVNGNHEGENGWLLNSTTQNLAVWTSNTRNKYYLNPKPDNFYTGNGSTENFVGRRGGYYAWNWGDALLVVLDPYWYTTSKARTFEENWNFTLGKTQYDWFRNVLESSLAKYKFVFCHNLVGGFGKDNRGGTEPAKYFEWGGSNADGSYGFDTKRPGWGKPIHKLMVDNKVNIFFHGHDHFYAKQELDGVIYQLVPQPGNPNFKSISLATDYGYVNGLFMPPSGHLRVKVTTTGITVDYIRAYLPINENKSRKNGELGYSYSVTTSTTN